jgi:hypothetical protein
MQRSDKGKVQRSKKLRLRLPPGPRRVLATAKEAAMAGVASEPEPGTPHRLVTVEDVWITAHDGPWVVAYRLALQRGRLVIGELRVYPGAPSAKSRNVDSGEIEWISGPEPRPWDDRRLLGINAPVPLGGLTSSVVHRLRPAADVNEVGRGILRELRDSKSWLWTRIQSAGAISPDRDGRSRSHRMGGPVGRGLRFYKGIAAVYSNSAQQPVQAVRNAFPELSASAATAAIWRARHRYGLLPPTSRGRVGTMQRI